MLNHITDQNRKMLLGNRVLSYPLLATATAADAVTFKTTNTLDYTVKGRVYTKTATVDLALSAATQGANKSCYYLVYINAAGTFSVFKGVDHATAPEIPTIDDMARAGIDPYTICLVGLVKIVNAIAGNGTFKLGTNNISTTVVVTGTPANGTPVVTAIPSTANLHAGMSGTSADVGAGNVIVTVDSATQVTLTANCTAAVNPPQSISFTGGVAGITATYADLIGLPENAAAIGL